MPHPYLRQDELRTAQPSGDRTTGIAAWVDGRRYFFPGGTRAIAMSLAHLVHGAKLNAPATRIEFGGVHDGAWVRSEVVKAGMQHESA